MLPFRSKQANFNNRLSILVLLICLYTLTYYYFTDNCRAGMKTSAILKSLETIDIANKDKLVIYVKGFNDGWYVSVDEFKESKFEQHLNFFCPEYRDKVRFVVEESPRLGLQNLLRKTRPINDSQLLALELHRSDVVIVSFRHLSEVDAKFIESTKNKIKVVFTHEPPHITLDFIRRIFGKSVTADNSVDPVLTEKGKFLNNYFNYVFSYSHGMDFTEPYAHWPHIAGKYANKTHNLWQYLGGKEDKQFMEQKTRLAISFVSNCGAEGLNWSDPYRMSYIKALKTVIGEKFLSLGKCGLDSTNRFKKLPEPEPISNSKFYLSFENSRCPYYITEKLWAKTFLNQAVPVVGGPKRKVYEELIPKDSFIHIDDFESAEELGKHLLYLDNNDEEYLKYFAWKNRQDEVESIRSYFDQSQSGICNLVEQGLAGKLDSTRKGNFLERVLEEYNSCSYKVRFSALSDFMGFLGI